METKFQFITKRNLIILITLCWIYIITLYLWNIQSIYDPFFLSRLAELNSNILNIGAFQDLPYSYSLNIMFSKILGYKFIQNGYIPFVQLIALFSLLLFGKTIYKKFENPYRSLFFVISISAFLTVFLTALPFTEYYIAYALYPLFLGIFLNYTYKKSYQLSILLILIFMSIDFFAIPMSLWIIEFVLLFFILIYLSKYFSPQIKSKYIISTSLVILFIVIWIFWNYKLFHAISTNTFDSNTLISLLENLIYSRTGETLSNYQYIQTSYDPIALWGARVNLVLVYIPIFLVFLYEFTRRNVFFFMHSKEDIFIISIIFPFICDFLIYGFSGLLSFRYSALIFPFVSYFYLLKYLSNKPRLSRFRFINFFKSHNRKIINLYLILIILSSIIIVNTQINQISPALPLNSVDEVTKWYPQYIVNNSNLVTDYKTESYFQYYLKSSDPNYQTKRITFTSGLYSYLIDPNAIASPYFNNSDIRFNYFMVNNQNLNQPILQGPPLWIRLQPLSLNIENINRNINLDLIYDSKSILIYKKE